MNKEDVHSDKVNTFKIEKKSSPSKLCNSNPNGILKKRGRTPKAKVSTTSEDIPLKQTKVTDSMKKVKRTINRFKGVTKEELLTRFLPDRIKHGLDILIIGINPGLFAAYKGHHYAGPGNHFWSCINMSGLVDKPSSFENDIDLLHYGIGFSTIVQRTTPSSKDLTSQEIREGGKELIEKIKKYQPKIAVFNGKGIYEVFSKEVFGQKKKDFTFGKQACTIPETNTFIYVMPSTSARCAQFPRAQDKVHFFIQLKKLRDELKGVQVAADVEETNYTFNLKKATEMARVEKVKLETHDPSYEDNQQIFPSASANPEIARMSGALSPSNDQPCNSNSQPMNKVTLPRSRKRQVGGTSASGHPNLVKFLCQNDDSSESAPTQPVPQRPVMSNLQEVVSEEQKNERVGKWVRTQINQNYESEPPMGYEERLRAVEVAEQPESDHGSQQSMVSAGVSGSTSTGSTSGYGSVDNNPHRQDRVEMWVREQQYVRQMNIPPELRRPPQQPVRNGEMEQNPIRQPEPALAGPPYDVWNNLAIQQIAFPGASSASNSMDSAFRPPVPLYSTWGGNETGHFSGLAANLNNNNSVIRPHSHSQLNINPLNR